MKPFNYSTKLEKEANHQNNMFVRLISMFAYQFLLTSDSLVQAY